MFLPQDHCHCYTVNSESPNYKSPVGDTWNIQEFLGASRGFTFSSFRGFNATSEAQVNVNVSVAALNSTGLHFQLSMFGVDLTSNTHTWNNLPGNRVHITTTFQIGNPILPADINKLINCGFSGGEDPLVTARKLQLHAIEEFGKYVGWSRLRLSHTSMQSSHYIKELQYPMMSLITACCKVDAG
jgi:hypothetical protein